MSWASVKVQVKVKRVKRVKTAVSRTYYSNESMYCVK